MYELKTDPKFPYHYLISVGIRDMFSKDRGKLYLKHGPLQFTNNDVSNVQSSVMLSKDKLFKTTNREAMDNFNVAGLVGSIHGMLMAATANQCTVHHFSSETPIDDDYWEGFVNLANTNKSIKEKLFEATINSRGFI